MKKRIVVKIGTSVISDSEGMLNKEVVLQIIKQIAALQKSGNDLVVVTSGAVASGRGQLRKLRVTDEVIKKQVWASVGQVRIMDVYANGFSKFGVVCSQVLVTKEDFRDKTHHLNMQNCFEALLKNGIVPVVNENDVTATQELIFTDNDELMGLLATMLSADVVIILSSVSGVYDDAQKVISEITSGNIDECYKFVQNKKSTRGRGGMHTKFNIARKLMIHGVTTYIANGKRKNVISDLIKGKNVGTRFTPTKKFGG